MKLRYITKGALNAEKFGRGRVSVWNDSQTARLTMAIREIKYLERRFFIDVEDVIPNDLMGKLLHHFRDERKLVDESDLCLV